MKNTIKLEKTTLLILGILLFQISFSQENFLPGYIIQNEGDTLHGLIDYRNWSSNPDKVTYKPKMEDISRTFLPTDIREFSVNNEKFESAIIETEVSPTKTNQLENDSKLKIKIDTIFLQALVIGNKSLYYYKNVNQKVNFYLRKGTEFELLRYKRYLKISDGKTVVGEDKVFLGQLFLYLNDCISIKEKLKNTSYKINSLMELYKYYYACVPSEPSFNKDKEKIHLEFGVLAGVTSTELTFGGNERSFNYLLNAKYDLSTNFTSGLFLDFLLPRNQRKWSINNELLYSSYSVNGMYEYVENSNKSTTTTTEFEYAYLKVNNLLRYRYPIRNMQLVLNAGFSNGLAIHEKNYQKRELKVYDTKIVVEEKAINNTRRHEQGYVIGTGIKYKAFSVEMRFEKGNGISESVTLSSSTKRYFLLVGYKF